MIFPAPNNHFSRFSRFARDRIFVEIFLEKNDCEKCFSWVDPRVLSFVYSISCERSSQLGAAYGCIALLMVAPEVCLPE